MWFPIFLLTLSWALVPDQAQPQTSPSASVHAPWDALLKAHVRDGLVDYDAFAQAPQFKAYLESLGQARPESWSREDRLAFWINAYNAYTIQLINTHQERGSIRNINKALGFFKGKGPWSEALVRASGRTLTLDGVEQGIIRVEFQEPRVHMALVCAAVSCPSLRSEAYEGPRIDAQLQDQTRTFLRNRPKENRLDAASRTLYLSQVFKWYRTDFGSTDAEILTFVTPYLESKPENGALMGLDLKIVYTEYDWSLNIQRLRQPQ